MALLSIHRKIQNITLSNKSVKTDAFGETKLLPSLAVEVRAFGRHIGVSQLIINVEFQ